MGRNKSKWTAIILAVLIIIAIVIVAVVHSRDVELDSYWVRNPAKFCSGYSGYATMDPARCYDFEKFYEDFVGTGREAAQAQSGTGREARGGAKGKHAVVSRIGRADTGERAAASHNGGAPAGRQAAENGAGGAGASTPGTAKTGTWRDILPFVKIDVCSERNASEDSESAAGLDNPWIARGNFIAEPLYCIANDDKVTVRITFDLDGLRAAYPNARKLSGDGNVITKAYTISGLKQPTVLNPFAMLTRVSVDRDGNLVYTWTHNVVPCGNYFLKHANFTNFDLLDGNGQIVESNVVVFRADGAGAGADAVRCAGRDAKAAPGTKTGSDSKPRHWKVGDRVRVSAGTSATHYLRDYGIVVKPTAKVFVVQR